MSSSNDLRKVDKENEETPDTMKIREVELEDTSLLVSGENRFEPSFKLPELLEEEEHFLNNVTYNDLLNTGVRRDDRRGGFALVSRWRSLLRRLESLNNSLTETTSGLSLRLQHAEQQGQLMGAICGLAALPPEVLSNIFSFAVYGDPSNEPRYLSGPLHSMHLSHVCRHFRDVVLPNPHFWTEISTTPRRPGMGLVEACIQRSRNRPLDIYLNLYTSQVRDLQMLHPNGNPMMRQHLECDPVLPLLLPHVQRWRSLHLNYVEAEGFSGSTEMFEPLEGALFPKLDTIAEYHYEAYRDDSYRDMPYVTSWNTPALTALILCDCLPRSMLSLASIAVFHVELFALPDVIEMLDLLNKMESLGDLYIDISRYQWYEITDEDELIAHDPIVLENVKKFTFCFASSHATHEKKGDFKRLNVIFSKVQVPNTTHMRLEGRKSVTRQPLSRYTDYPLILHEFLSDLPVRFPKVVNCEISISRYNGFLSYDTTLPVQFPAGLEELKLSCNTSLCFPVRDAAEAVRELSKLRTLTLGLSSLRDTSDVTEWVRWMVDNVKLHDGWQSFEKLLLLKCNDGMFSNDVTYEYEGLILRDDVIKWCTDYDGAPLCDNSDSFLYDEYDSDL